MSVGDTRLRKKRRVVTAVQITLTLAAFAYLFEITDLEQLSATFRKAPGYCVPAAVGTLLALIGAAAVRWRLLFAAYGAIRPPPLWQLFRLQLIGLFYNMLPGAVGGDVVRGLVSRDAFGERGVSAGLAVVLIERLLGLSGLMLLVLLVLSVHPVPALHLPAAVLWLGMGVGLAAIAVLAVGRHLARFVPEQLGRLRGLIANLPELSNPLAFLAAAVVSVINQALVGAVGHIAIAPLAPSVHLLDSLVLSPISFAAIFFPFTVAGAGTRDAAMIALYSLIGVPKATTLSASLEILLAYLLVASLGGILAAISSMRAPAHAATPADSD